MMGNQRIGADRDDLVEEVQGKEVVGKGDPDGPERCQGKTGIEAGLGMFLEAPHIAHGVEDGNDPQRGGHQGEDHRQGVGPQGDRHTRKDSEHVEDQGLA